jgi:chromosome segregation ATPase
MKMKELQVKIVDLETKAYQSSPRPVTGSRRMESRIEELTSQLTQTSRDKSETVRLQRSADKNARDAKQQLVESDRQRARLEEEVRNYESKILSMRQAVDDLVSYRWLIRTGRPWLTMRACSKRLRAISSWRAGAPSGRRPTSSRRR